MMNPLIENALMKAALKNEAGRDDFLKIIQQVPLSKENFDNLLQCTMGIRAQQWVIDFYTPELLVILSNPNGWDDWVQDFPFLDELILSTSQDPQWLDVLSFRWTISDGRPDGGPRNSTRSNTERLEFFAACWKATIASDNTSRLQQMLNHPVWKTMLKEEYVCSALWRPLEVWCVFHDHHQPLPLRSFWHGMMATHHLGAHTDNHKKLYFLIREAGSTAEFIVQQYAHFWHHPLPQDLNDAVADLIHKVAPDKKWVGNFHQRVVNFLLENNSANKEVCAGEMVNLLKNSPLFDEQHFILALVDFKATHLSDQQSAVVEIVFNNLEPAVQNTLLPQCVVHPTFENLAFVQKYRIEQNIQSADATVRLKKI